MSRVHDTQAISSTITKIIATTEFYLIPKMNRSEEELVEGHQGQRRNRPCHSRWSVLLENAVV